jgi:hypothetical protein
MKYLSNNLAVDPSTITRHASNGLNADQRVTLCSANAAGDVDVWFLETNGDPVLVMEDNLAECANALDMEGSQLERETGLSAADFCGE